MVIYTKLRNPRLRICGRRSATSALLVGAFAACLNATGHANLNGRDDFNDNSEDPTKWGADTGFGTPAGVLNEINGRLEFSSSSTVDTYLARPWILNLGSFTTSWAVQLDTVVLTTSGPNGGVAFGLEVWDTSSPNLYVGIEHDTFSSTPAYFSYRGTTNDTPLDTAASDTTPAIGAVRIAYDAFTKTLSTSYDVDGASNGYLWTPLTSFGIAGSGGAATTNWGMTNSDTFTVVAFGFSSGVTAAPGQVYGDNFAATGVVNWTGASNASWNTAANWSTAAVPGINDDALFPAPIPGTGGTITLANGEVANSLNFIGNYTLTGGTLALTSGQVAVILGAKATIASALVGTSGLTMATQGTLILSGHNTYSGGTTAAFGTIQLGANNSLPATTTLTINATTGNTQGLFDLHGFTQTIAGLTIVAPQVDGGSTALTGAGTLTLNGALNFVDNSSFPGDAFGATIAVQTLDLGGAVRTFTVAGQDIAPTPELAITSVIQNGGVIINANPSSTNGTPTIVEFSGTSTYTGATTINAGTLQVDGKLAKTAVTVNSGGKLSGVGTIAGNVTILSGGDLSPGKASGPGTLSVANLVLNAGANSDFRLAQAGTAGGGVNDLAVVAGNLTLGGALNLTGLSGFGAGTYELFSYTGTLTGALNFGSFPVGFTAANFTLQTSVAHQVNLLVTLPALQYWNGGMTSPNSVVNGGSGTWDNTTTNWTNSTGTTAASWGQFTGVFSSGSGTVTLGDNITANEVRFVSGSGAYTVVVSPGDTLELINTGLTNTSGLTQNFTTNTDGTGHAGTIIFAHQSTAGHLTQFTNNGSATAAGDSGLTFFNDSSTAGSAIIINNPGTVSGTVGAFTESGGTNFSDRSTAGTATITNNGANLANAFAGSTQFDRNSTAGSATIANNPATLVNGNSGNLAFFDLATAATATIVNNGATVNGAFGGGTNFNDSSTAGTATFTNLGGTVTGASGGGTFFNNSSTAGTATFTNLGGAADSAGGGIVVFNHTSTAGSAIISNQGGTVSGAYSGSTIFNNGSTAGSAKITSVGGAAANANGGGTNFNDNSTAGTATITNLGGTVSGAFSSFLAFNNNSTAGGATIANNAGTVANADNGGTDFNNNATAGTATITNQGSAVATADGGFTSFNNNASAASAKISNQGGKTSGTMGDFASAGGTEFNDSATAGSATITNTGATALLASPGSISFNTTSTAGSAAITNSGATVNGAAGGITLFFDGSLAGSATITNGGGTNGGIGGATFFKDHADGGTARIINVGNGLLDLSGLTDGRMNIGSLEGAGSVFLGANTLTVGGNNLSTTLSGVITDGGQDGGNGGSLVKTGTGILTLKGVGTYSGATTILQGTLQLAVNNALPIATALTINSADGTTAGRLDLQTFSQSIASLTIVAPATASTAVTGAGKLTLNGGLSIVDATANPGLNNPVTIAVKTLDLGGAVRTITDAGQRNIADLVIASVIQNGGLVINALNSTSNFPNPGTVELSGANTFAGTTEVQTGILVVGSSAGLGAATGISATGTTVDAGATLSLATGVMVGNEALVLNGFGAGSEPNQTYPQGGALNILHQLTGTPTATYAGAITIATNAAISANGGVLNLNGGIVQSGTTLTFNGNGAGGSVNIGTVGISGAAPASDVVVDGIVVTYKASNSYNGTTWIENGGTLNANFANALPTANGRSKVVLDSAASLPGSPITLPSSGASTLALGANQAAASLSGGVTSKVNLNASTLTIGFGSGLDVNGLANADFAGVISGTGGITKDESSLQVLSGANTYTGTTNVTAGTLKVTGSLAAGSTVNVSGTGTLAGSGTINGKATLAAMGAISLDPAATIVGTLAVTGGSWTGSGTVNGAVTVSAGAFNLTGGLTAPVGLTLTGGTLTGPGTLTGKLTDMSSGNSVFAGVIAGGSSTVTMNAMAGALTLTGANTYGGATTISAGTLQLGDGTSTVSSLGSGAISVAGTGILATNLPDGSSFARNVALTAATATLKPIQSGTNTLSGVLSGLGGLNQNGSGLTILSAGNTYSGVTSVTTGTLEVDGALAAASTVNVAAAGTLSGRGTIAGTVNVLAGGNLSALSSSGPGTLTVGKLVLNTGSNSDFQLAGPAATNSLVVVTGNLTLAGNININALTGFGIGSYTLFQYGGTLTNSGVAAINGTTGFITAISTGTAHQVNLVVSGTAITQYWDGTGAINNSNIAGGSGMWSNTANNWTDGGGVANTAWMGGTAVFNAPGGTVTLAAPISAQGLIFGGTGYTIAGTTSALNLVGGSGLSPGIIVSSAGAAVTIGATITGIAGFTAGGAGTLILTGGANSYSGGTNVNTGILQIGTTTTAGSLGAGPVSLGAGGGLTLVNAKGNLLANNFTNGIANTGTLTVNSALANTLSGALTDGASGALALIQSGTGTTILTNSGNTASGATTVSKGILQIGTATAAGSLGANSPISVGTSGTLSVVNVGGNNLASNISNGLGATGTVIVNSAGNNKLSGALTNGTGTLALTQSGAGTTTLTGADTYTGATTVSAGTLQIGDGINGSLTGAGAVTVSGTGVLALDLAGTTTFSRTISLGATGTSLRAIQNGVTTLAGVISGMGSVNQLGTGTTIIPITASETYTGATNVTTGTLENDGVIAAASTVNVAPAGTLAGNGSILGKATLTGNGTINLGAGGVIDGTLTVTGGNWTGMGSVGGLVTSSSGIFTVGTGANLTATAGLALTGGSLAGSGTITGTLTDTSIANTTFAGVIAGAASTVTMNKAASTLTLTGANTYGGATTVTAGTLQVGDGTATGATLGTSPISTATAGTLTTDLADGENFAKAVTDNGHVIVTGTTNNYIVSGIVSGTGNFTKTGANTVTVTGANTYKGGTVANSGTLLVNNSSGSGTGSGAVTINTGATVGGSGTLGGAVALNSGGFLFPGAASLGTAGTTLHATSLMWNGGGTLTLQLGAAGDELILSGALTKGSAGAYNLDIVDTGGGITLGTFTLATFASTTFAVGNFNLELPGNYAGHLIETATSLSIDITSGSGQQPAQSDFNDTLASGDSTSASNPGSGFSSDSDPAAASLSITPTPEPGSTALLAFGGVALLSWRPRRSAGESQV